MERDRVWNEKTFVERSNALNETVLNLLRNYIARRVRQHVEREAVC